MTDLVMLYLIAAITVCLCLRSHKRDRTRRMSEREREAIAKYWQFCH